MLSLPLLEAMLPRAHSRPSEFQPLENSIGAQPRFIACYVPNGVNIQQWVPEVGGPDYGFSPTLSVLEAHRADFVHHPELRVGSADRERHGQSHRRFEIRR